MTVPEMRECIRSLGKTETWEHRVNDMPPTQVMAIFYKSFQADGTRKPKKQSNNQTKNAQITLWDLPEAENWGLKQ